MKYFLPVLLLIFLLFQSCTEKNITEVNPDKVFTNDLLHADFTGRVVQNDSRAIVIVSQVEPVDTALINPSTGSFEFRDLRAGNYDVTIIADNYRIFRKLNVVLEGGTIVYFGEIKLSAIPDQIESVYPEDNSEIVYDWRYGRITISIMFTGPMNRESVENAFHVQPPAEGTFFWGNYTQAPVNGLYADASLGYMERGATITTFSKVASFTYSFARKDSYPDSTYKVTIDTTAKDTLGNHLRFPLVSSFKTVQSYSTINGIQTDPVNGDIDISPINYSSGINITFPKRMNKNSVEGLTTIQPGMNTIFLWPEDNKLRIYTGGPFMSDTTITVTIDSNAADKDGNKQGHNFTFSFRTAPLLVERTYPNNGQLFVSPSDEINIYFNNYVSLSSARTSISISPAVSNSITYSGSPPYEVHNAIKITSGSFAPNTKYTVTIDAGLQNMYGTPMKEPYSFSFVIRPN